MAQEGFRKSLFGDDGPDVALPCADGEAISMWVADMAFATAPAATDAMIERVSHPIFGYTGTVDDELFGAFHDWCANRYDWRPSRKHFVTARGVVPALQDLVEQIIGPGEKVLTLTPAYGNFEKSCTRHGRELVASDLVDDGQGNFALDFADLEAKLADPQVQMFLLCHPHNPTGRVFTEAELQEMAELCFANDVLVVSDEIHCDLLRTGVQHTPLAKLFPDSDQIITCMSTSKTFNLAGMRLAHVLIPHDGYRSAWKDRVSMLVNPVSLAAATGVLRDGGAWLTELCTYLDGNFEFLRTTLAKELPDAVFSIPDATYLAWIDVGRYVDVDTKISRHIAETSGLLVEGPDMFVANAKGRIRVNVACPRSTLEMALHRLVPAIQTAGGQ